MPRKPEIGEPAKYKYQPVRYSHFDVVDPGTSLVLTADPWSYLTAWLSKEVSGSRGDNRKRLERAKYFAQLAKSFCEAATALTLPSKGTLLYYGMLNLVKCFISVNGVDLEQGPEIHGCMVGEEEGHQIVIAGKPKKATSIFHEFARVLGTPPQGKAPLGLDQVLAQIPEIHEMAYTLRLLPNKERAFLPVTIDFLVNARHDKLFTEMRYQKKQEARFPNIQFLSGSRKTYFKQMPEADGWVVFRSKRKKALTKTNWETVYANIRREYIRFNLFSILTPEGYKYYCNLSEPTYHQLCYTLMFFFFIGTVTRYRPSQTEKLLVGELAPLLTEAATICPQQMLYQLVSMTTGRICVKPHAMLR